jgi:hypothetical protein
MNEFLLLATLVLGGFHDENTLNHATKHCNIKIMPRVTGLQGRNLLA